MNINYKQPQFELFPSSASNIDDTDKPRYLLAKVTFSIENLVVLLILCIMLAVFAFAIGVEQGKRIALFEQMQKINLQSKSKSLVKSSPVQAQVPGTQITQKPIQVQAGQTMQKRAGLPSTNVNTAAVAVQPAMTTAPAVLNAFAARPYTIQVASYKDTKFAEREAQKFQLKGWETQVLQKGSYVILCVGHFVTRQEADNFARRLRPTYKDYVVRRQ